MLNKKECTLVFETLSSDSKRNPTRDKETKDIRCDEVDKFSVFYYGDSRSLSDSINLRVQKHHISKDIKQVEYEGLVYLVKNVLDDKNSRLKVILDCELDGNNKL